MVAAYEASVLEQQRALLVHVVTGLGVSEDVEEVVSTPLCAIEGALLLGLSPEKRERVIRWAFAHRLG